MSISPDQQNEQHPMLPSGYWTGFYVHSHSAERHEMMIMLDFMSGIISGDGQDDVAAFTFDGTYDLTSMTCKFLKHYRTHSIDYRGNIDENGIWGKWYHVHNANGKVTKEQFDMYKQMMPDLFSGGFHIWPSNKEFSEYQLEVRKVREEEVVKEAG